MTYIKSDNVKNPCVIQSLHVSPFFLTFTYDSARFDGVAPLVIGDRIKRLLTGEIKTRGYDGLNQHNTDICSDVAKHLGDKDASLYSIAIDTIKYNRLGLNDPKLIRFYGELSGVDQYARITCRKGVLDIQFSYLTSPARGSKFGEASSLYIKDVIYDYFNSGAEPMSNYRIRLLVLKHFGMDESSFDCFTLDHVEIQDKFKSTVPQDRLAGMVEKIDYRLNNTEHVMPAATEAELQAEKEERGLLGPKQFAINADEPMTVGELVKLDSLLVDLSRLNDPNLNHFRGLLATFNSKLQRKLTKDLEELVITDVSGYFSGALGDCRRVLAVKAAIPKTWMDLQDQIDEEEELVKLAENGGTSTDWAVALGMEVRSY